MLALAIRPTEIEMHAIYPAVVNHEEVLNNYWQDIELDGGLAHGLEVAHVAVDDSKDAIRRGFHPTDIRNHQLSSSWTAQPHAHTPATLGAGRGPLPAGGGQVARGAWCGAADLGGSDPNGLAIWMGFKARC